LREILGRDAQVCDGFANVVVVPSDNCLDARATAARFFMPPDNARGVSFRKSARPTTDSFIQVINRMVESSSRVSSRKR
jgi:hypothetical protein